MSTFIAAYTDGKNIIRSSFEGILSLPGDYYIFSVHDNYELNETNGVCHLDKNQIAQSFKIAFLELVDLKHLPSNTYNRIFQFKIFDHKKNKLIIHTPETREFPFAIGRIVKMMVTASKFESWEDYESAAKELEINKKDILRLKDELKSLEKRNKEINEKLDQ